MVHDIGLVQYDVFVHAWVLDLPGCVAGGHDLEELRPRLSLSIAEHQAWLHSCGERCDDDRTWRVVESVDAASVADSGGDPLFKAERAAVSRAELESLARRVERACAGLIAASQGLPAAVL